MPNTPITRSEAKKLYRLLIGVIALTLVATLFAIYQRFSDDNEQQAVNAKFFCLSDIQQDQIRALNERTELSRAERTANIAVQNALLQVQTLILERGTPEEILRKQNETQTKFPYPTVEQIQGCLS
jgi:hypothetical protein